MIRVSKARLGFYLIVLSCYLMMLSIIVSGFAKWVFFTMCYTGFFLIVDGMFDFMEETG